MKPFFAMYLLIGLAHGLAIAAGQKGDLQWWEPPVIVGIAAVYWPVIMSLVVRDVIHLAPRNAQP